MDEEVGMTRIEISLNTEKTVLNIKFLTEDGRYLGAGLTGDTLSEFIKKLQVMLAKMTH